MSVPRSVLLALSIAAGVCVTAVAASAGTFAVAPLTGISGPSPFAGCTAGRCTGKRPVSKCGGGTVG